MPLLQNNILLVLPKIIRISLLSSNDHLMNHSGICSQHLEHRTYLDLYISQYDWYKYSLWFHTSSINLYLNLCFTYQVSIRLNISSILNPFNPFCATRTFLVVSILNSFNILSMYFWHNHISVYWCQIFGFCLSLSSRWNSYPVLIKRYIISNQ